MLFQFLPILNLLFSSIITETDPDIRPARFQKEVQKNFTILNSRVTALTGAFDTLSEVFVEEFDLLREEVPETQANAMLLMP